MHNSPEKFGNIDYSNPEYKTPRVLKEKSLEKALEFFKENLPDIEIFKDAPGYDPRMYERDLAYTKKLEKLNEDQEDEDKQWSIIQEAIILNELEMSEWFGDSIRTIRPTNHADFVEKVDGILQFKEQAVSFDATYSKEPYHKIHHNRGNIDSGNLNEITYFYDEETDFKGSVNIPGIVLGFSRENLKQLAEKWLYSQEGIPGSQKEIAEHPIQMLLLYQALMQFSTYELHNKNKTKNEKFSLLFSSLKKQVLEVYKEKIESNPALKNYELDDFTEHLCSELSREYNIDLKEIKENIWPKKNTGKTIKVPRNYGDSKKAA